MGIFDKIKDMLFSKETKPVTPIPREYRKERVERAKSLTLEQIEYIMSDTQVETAYHLFESFLLSRNMMLQKTKTSETDDELQRTVEAFVEDIYNRLKLIEHRLRRDLYTAVLYGFSAHEIIFKQTVFDDRVVITLDDLVPIHPSTVYYDDSFVYDDDGGFVGLKQVVNPVFPRSGDEKEVLIPADKLLLYSFKSHFGDLRGRSILTGIYDNVQFKEDTIRWLLIFLQKHENPTLVGKISNPAHKEDLLKSLEMIDEGLTKITVGKEDEIQLIESNKGGEAFFEFIKYNDNIILRQFLIGTLLLGQSDKSSGSYAQSLTQSNILRTALEGIHNDIALKINEIIRRLVEYNFGEDAVKYTPTIRFESFKGRDTIELLKVLSPYANAMLVDTESEWFKKLIEYSIQDITGETVPIGEDEHLGPSNELEKLPSSEMENSILDKIKEHLYHRKD